MMVLVVMHDGDMMMVVVYGDDDDGGDNAGKQSFIIKVLLTNLQCSTPVHRQPCQ